MHTSSIAGGDRALITVMRWDGRTPMLQTKRGHGYATKWSSSIVSYNYTGAEAVTFMFCPWLLSPFRCCVGKGSEDDTNQCPGWGDCKDDYCRLHHHQSAFADTQSRKTTSCEQAGIGGLKTSDRMSYACMSFLNKNRCNLEVARLSSPTGSTVTVRSTIDGR